MATEKPIISIVVDEEMLNKIEDYQYGNRIPSRSKALNAIIKIGLEKIMKDKEDKPNM